MKILFLNDFIPPRHVGGPGKRNFELAQELKNMGNDIYFITSCQDKKLEGEEIKEGIKVFNIYSKYPVFLRHYVSLYNPLVVKKAKKIIEKLKPDIVHADTIHIHLSYALLKIARKNSKAVFLTSRDFMLFYYGKFAQTERICGKINYKAGLFDNLKFARKRFNPFRNMAIKHYLKFLNKIFAVSNELAKALKQNGIINTEVLHNGLPVGNPKEGTFSDNILLSGRINEAKGVYALLEAMPLVKKEIPDSKLIIVGAPEEEIKRINKESANLGLIAGKDFEVFKWINGSQMEDMVKTAGVIVSPSLYPDPFPGVNLEAAQYCKPVVTTCFGGAKEFVLDGKTGYVVNPFDKKSLVEKITYLLKNKDKAKLLGQNAFIRLKEEFSLKSKAAKLIEFYKKYSQ